METTGRPQERRQRALLEGIERTCRERIAPRAAEAEARGAVPAASWKDLASCGYLGLFHPTSWGGHGGDGEAQARAMESLARACASTFWAASISSVLCGKMLYNLCTPEHQWRWLRPILAGEKIGCFAASEDGAGSDPGSYRATVRRTPRGLRLTGVKSRISNASTADVAVVLARIEDGGHAGLCYAVVDLRRRGIRREELPHVGLKAMSWGSLCFEGVELEEHEVIRGASVERTLITVEWGQLMQAWSSIGLASAALEACGDHMKRREAFGRPIAHLPVLQARLARMRAEIDAARLLTTEVSRRKARGQAAREAVLIAKIHATEMAVRCADDAMRTLGGWGFSPRYPVERIYRDSLANVPAGLPTDRLREMLGCALVDVSPWSYEPEGWLAGAGLSLPAR
ncbi:MAG: acyl-CoA/acyl-ACP dehydrogenase [Polyangiaceae bacterium]|jgi:alkylation response protein AidB-like acyl-CoA dehydrogenase|nr:acyl-CoA/acyl-ACP dehydrogenase [Polyangiaceae bacterium]